MISDISAESDAEEYRRMWRFKHLITWLQPTDVQADHERLRFQRLEGLGSWLFEEPSFKEWQSRSYDVLWIQGIPG